jgi:hypothetical protein
MKIFKYMVFLLSLVSFVVSCDKDSVNTPNFEVSLLSDANNLYAGTADTFLVSGFKGDNLTVFTGDPGHNYDLYPVSKGVVVSSPYQRYIYTYPQGGDYTVTFLAINPGGEGQSDKIVKRTIVVHIQDKRSLAFKTFTVKAGSTSYSGKINNTDNTITVTVEPKTDLKKLLPSFTKTVDSSKVVYGPSNKTYSKTDTVDFTNPVSYTISANENPNTRTYSVTVKERSLYTGATLLTLTDVKHSITAKADSIAKTVTLKVPWGVNLDTIYLNSTISAGASAKIGDKLLNGKSKFDLHSSTNVDVTSEDKNVTSSFLLKLKQDSAFTSFSVNDSVNSLNPSPSVVIDHSAKAITVSVLKGTSLSRGYIATFKGSEFAIVKVGSTVQVSGTTKNFFTSPVTYTITSKETGQSANYVVSFIVIP